MGLAERRLAEKIKTTSYVELVNKIQTMAGYPVQLEIDWDTFMAYDEYPLSRLEDTIFEHIEGFVKGICIDDMGKEALKEKLVAIKLTNIDDNDNILMDFKEGNLHLALSLAGGSYNYYSSSDMISYMEKLL